MNTKEIVSRARDYIALERDETFRNEIAELLAEGQNDELRDRFYTNLEFGTAGLRGVIGGGSNRMNSFVVERVTQGLTNYLKRTVGSNINAVISYDSRKYSKRFAKIAALVLAANEITVYLFDQLHPTPMLSFAVRELQCAVGIMITASHNPPDYNGYKVFWSNGAQIIAPHDRGIIDAVNNVGANISRIEEEAARSKGVLRSTPVEIDNRYVAMVKNMSLQPNLLRQHGAELRVAYTPLHGTGAPWVERILGELGITVDTEPSQREPDGTFPTVEFPNPEERAALKKVIELGQRIDADLIIANDPDADRIGAAVPNNAGEIITITGNQLGALFFDYVLGQRQVSGNMPHRPMVVKTIVTTELQRKIALHYNAECYDTLTGFNNIAAMIASHEENPDKPTFLIGGEESYGHMYGLSVRDKDGISAATLCSEMVLHFRKQGIGLLERLEQLYQQFGYYQEETISRYFPGESGRETMALLMKQLRENSPQTIGDVAVRTIRDMQYNRIIELPSGAEKPGLNLPRSNVLQFFLENESVVSARPSGTEPKIKFYISCCGQPNDDLAKAREQVGNAIRKILRDVDRWSTID